jgi:translation initiation factor eIF-2B subunit epsilon
MSNQNQNKKKPPQTQNREDLQQDKLQALVLLDSYSNKFEPLSSYKAECLLPFVGGRTLLDNSIEFLIENGVEEIYLFCTKHYHQIKEYLDEKNPIWSRQVEIHFLYNFTCRNLGDAMRDIDARGLIRSNFILLTSTSVVSNLKLKEHLEQHKQTSKTDKNAIMTMLCLSRLTDLSYSSSLKDSGVHDYNNTLIVHNNTNCILHYEQFAPGISKKKLKQVSIPYEAVVNGYTKARQTTNPAVESANAKYKLQNQTSANAISGIQGGSISNILHLKTVQQRNDLLESQIYLCSPYVLHFFTDNFDFNTMSDFVKGVLIDEEVSGYTIYIDMFKLKFGSHFSLINNINSYYFETMRILQRPDLILDFKATITYRRLLDRVNVYLSKKSTKFGDNIKLDKNVFIDSNCKIGENCELVNCFIGSNCIIGNNVKLANSIIWPNTRIGNDCVVNASLLGNHVRIGNGCTLIENTLMSFDCHVKDKTSLNERGVYLKKETNKEQKKTAEADKLHDNVEFAKHLSVKEDNYTKYFSIEKDYIGSNEEDDDEFEPIEGEENRMQSDDDESDNDSVTSEAKNLADTSKNRHFYVWKLQTQKKPTQSVKHLRQADQDSENDLDYESSDYSSSETETESDEEEYQDFLDSDDEFRPKSGGASAKAKSKVTSPQENTEIFYNEVVELLERGLKLNLDPNNIILEINSSKHANNVVIDEVCYYVAKAVLSLPIVLNEKTKKAQTDASKSAQFEYLTVLKAQLEKNLAILQNYHTTTKQSQKIFLDSMMDFFIESKLNSNYTTKTGFLDAYFAKVAHYLYNDCEDFLSEALVIEWYNKQKEALETKKDEALASNIELKRHAINKLGPFINWLQESEEEDEDDDDE